MWSFLQNLLYGPLLLIPNLDSKYICRNIPNYKYKVIQ